MRQYESTRTPKLTRDLVSGITRRVLAWEQTSRFRSTGSKMVRAWSNPESLPLLAMGGSDGLPVAHAKYFRMRISPDEQI